jgi:drug/metabolite transporter (DMT)-like permease
LQLCNKAVNKRIVTKAHKPLAHLQPQLNKISIVRSDLAAIGAVLLWASLASLAIALGEIPPLLMTGIALLFGSLISVFLVRGNFRKLVPEAKTLLLGVYGLFGYHVALFAGLQNAPAVQANLVNYLWPLLIVVLAPLFFHQLRLGLKHVLSAIIGFSGAAIAILSGAGFSRAFEIGYVYSLIAAVIWATYSLGSKRIGSFPTAQVGSFALVAGLLALLGHFFLEAPVEISSTQWLWLILMGIGPLGGSFYLWDYALKHGNPQRVGLIAFFTPLCSTTFALLVTGQDLTWPLLMAALLIFGAALVGARGR